MVSDHGARTEPIRMSGGYPRSPTGLLGCRPLSGYLLVWCASCCSWCSGAPSPAARPCRRHRPTGGCWVRPAGMSGGYPRSPTGLFGCRPLSGYFLVWCASCRLVRVIVGDRRRPLAGLRRARSVPPCATDGLTNAEREKRTSFSRSPPPLGRYHSPPPPHLLWRRRSKVWW